MVSYADYPSAMPPHDFDLYPADDNNSNNYSCVLPASQAYLPTSFMDNNPFTAFESTQPPQAFSQAQDFQYNCDLASLQLKQNYQNQTQTQTPSGSPQSASHSFDMQPPVLSASSESGASVSSSAMGSPSLGQAQFQESWGQLDQGLGLIKNNSFMPENFDAFSGLVSTKDLPGCVDPTLINPFPSPLPYSASPYPEMHPSPHFPFVDQPPSPAPSQGSLRNPLKHSRSQSPYVNGFQPYPWGRRPSVSSIHSRHSTQSRRSGSYELDEDHNNKGLCPIPECGRVFKDLKAHMLTHQHERPEKCPIVTCEYHLKGFARKYDKNRHTLTHYKGTMVCGFCPGSGSAAEKSFNRADVFKRHLTSVHGVEQNPPNSRKKSPTTTKKAYNVTQQNAGTCSTCSVTFANAQEFYEHLDDCVLRVVQQADPSEAINQKLLGSIADDEDVKETMERHYLPSTDVLAPTYDEQQDEDDEDEDEDEGIDTTYGTRRSGKGALKSKKDNQH